MEAHITRNLGGESLSLLNRFWKDFEYVGGVYSSALLFDRHRKRIYKWYSDDEWEKELALSNVAHNCCLVRTIKSAEGKYVLPWESIEPENTKEKKVSELRRDFGHKKGLSFTISNKNIYFGFACVIDSSIRDDVRIFLPNEIEEISSKANKIQRSALQYMAEDLADINIRQALGIP